MANDYVEQPAEQPESTNLRLRAWQRKVSGADTDYRDWEDEFGVDLNEKYYLGHQWDEGQKDNYTINLCFPTVEARLPSLLFYRPQMRITPKPARLDDPGTLLDERARLRQDTLNSHIQDEKTGWEEVGLALRESQYSFGLVEVGYSNSTTDNPNAGKAMLDEESGQELFDMAGEQVTEDPKLISEESLWVRRIPSKCFRASVTKQHNMLKRNEWVGYYQWEHIEDVKVNPLYSNTYNVKSTARIRHEYAKDHDITDPLERDRHTGMLKVWHIWNIRDKKRYIFPDGGKVFFVDGVPYPFLPLAMLKYHEKMDSVYPCPPMSNWRDPQDELNESRNQQKTHRRRYNRRYLVKAGIDDEELAKLEDGDDGTYIKVPNIEGQIAAVPDAPLDRSFSAAIPSTKDDFREISGYGGEQRGIDQAKTATQANIIDVNLKMRETYARAQVALWLAEIGFIMLQTIEEYVTLPMWIKRNVDGQAMGAIEEAMRVQAIWQQIKAQDLGELCYEVTVDVESMTPVTEDLERNQWMQALALLQQPPLVFLFSVSDMLLKKTMGYFGVRSSKDLGEIKMALAMVMQWMQMQQMAETANAAGAKPGAGGARKPDTHPPPAHGAPAAGNPMSQLIGRMGLGGKMNGGVQ